VDAGPDPVEALNGQTSVEIASQLGADDARMNTVRAHTGPCIHPRPSVTYLLDRVAEHTAETALVQQIIQYDRHS